MPLVTSYTEAQLVELVGGAPGDIDTTAKNAIGTVAHDQFGNEYVYLKGIGSTVEGMAVTYDEAGVTALLVANAKGPVAWATGATVASTFGWYARKGETLLARVITATADNTFLGKETTDGEIGDGRAAGDQIYGVIARAANASGATVLQVIQVFAYPYVDDVYGA
jgi:hypothetical protein